MSVGMKIWILLLTRGDSAEMLRSTRYFMYMLSGIVLLAFGFIKRSAASMGGSPRISDSFKSTLNASTPWSSPFSRRRSHRTSNGKTHGVPADPVGRSMGNQDDVTGPNCTNS